MIPNGFGFINPNLMAQQLLLQQRVAMANAGGLPQLPLIPISAHGAVAAVGVPAPARPSPMLVPPGMGIDDSNASPATDSDWTEHKHTDGRYYYHNRITKQSSWVKPEALKTAQERSASVQQQQQHQQPMQQPQKGQWKEFTTNEGRPYYYNTETKKTQWVRPDGEDVSKGEQKSVTTATPIDTAALAAAVQQKKTESDLDKAMKATLAAMSSVPLPAEKKEDDTQVNDEAELKKRQSERFRDLLRDKYNDGKITTNCNWDQAVKWIQNDPRFRILNKVSEKKQLFNAWKVQRGKEERDEKRLAIKKAKEDLETFLQEHPKMKESLKYQKASEMFAKEPLWMAVNDEDRKEIFKDCIGFVSRRDKEKKEECRNRNLAAFSHILQSMDQITYKTTWAQAQRLLIENPQFAEETDLQLMDKEDALSVFEEHIKQSEIEHEEEKEQEERRIRRQHRKTREDYRLLLEDLHKKGEITSMSLWSSLFPIISTDHRFECMLFQPGSSPLDLFKFYVEDLKEQYIEDRRLIKDILTEKSYQVVATTEFKEFSEWVLSHPNGEKVDHGNMKLCYNSMVEKAENKAKDEEKESLRKKRRLESEFRNLLKAHNVDEESEWSVIKPKIEKEKAYLALENDEERESAFMHYKNGTTAPIANTEVLEKSKKKKKDKKKKSKRSDNNSESEGEIREKEKKKKKKHSKEDRQDDEERGKKSKKSRKRSSSRTDSPRHSSEKRKRRESETE
uniref:WW domain-containing protein n=1 Tax=Caenorhabditis tropicalis TaxID=1561998 RepID=A0A1I7UQN4_9PELO